MNANILTHHVYDECTIKLIYEYLYANNQGIKRRNYVS